MSRILDEPTILVPTAILNDYQMNEAVSYNQYRQRTLVYEAEEKLHSGNLSTPEKIKATYALCGRKFDWHSQGNYMRLMYAPPIQAPTWEDMDKVVNEAVGYETFDFTREVIRSKDFTVTRISCQGITVEETIS